MDKIFLRDLKLKTRIGIFEWEKQIDQIININIEVGTDIKKAASTDDVSFSLDYKSLSIKVKEYVQKKNHQLILRICFVFLNCWLFLRYLGCFNGQTRIPEVLSFILV